MADIDDLFDSLQVFHTRVTWWSDRQQVSLGLRDFSDYSGRFQQCCNLGSLEFSFDLPIFYSPFQAIDDRSELTIVTILTFMFHRIQISR